MEIYNKLVRDKSLDYNQMIKMPIDNEVLYTALEHTLVILNSASIKEKIKGFNNVFKDRT